jgi:DNA-binding MarR family transcriptional regulator
MDGPSQTDLAMVTGMDRSTVAELTKRLSARGYIERKRLPHDERTFVVSLTLRGVEALKRGEKAYAAVANAVASVDGYVDGLDWIEKFVKKYTNKLDKKRGKAV